MSIGDAPGVQFSFVSKITNSGTLRHHALVHVLGKVGKKQKGEKVNIPLRAGRASYGFLGQKLVSTMNKPKKRGLRPCLVLVDGQRKTFSFISTTLLTPEENLALFS